MSIDKDIINEFVQESKQLIEPLIEVLESLETAPFDAVQLIDYGNKVDRVMGAAKSLAAMVPETHPLHAVANYSGLCKAVSYKASKVGENEQLYRVSVAFLIDATEILLSILSELAENVDDFKIRFSETFLERLRWISSQFSASVSGTLQNKASSKMNQSEIDVLLSKLGVG